MKITTTLILCSVLLLILTACTNAEAEQPTFSPSATVEPQKTNTQSPTPESGNVITQNQIQFDMDLEAGKMNVTADYVKSGIDGNSFLLNRDFVVSKIECDGTNVNVDEIVETVYLDDEYEIKQYNLPSFEKTVHIEYVGVLSGKTGLAPYVRETISPEFTFLRWETFCHPLFATADNYSAALFNPMDLNISVSVPEGYAAEFIQNHPQQTSLSDSVIYTASEKLMYVQVAVAIAKYKSVETETGEYYFLESTDVEKATSIIDPTMTHANAFMNEHFGKVEFAKKLRVVEIPNGFGSFAVTETNMTFVEGYAFNSVSGMRQLIHEFTHIGWNAMTTVGSAAQTSRFFDEAFASYFEYRVMCDIQGDGVYNSFQNTKGYDLVPISEFGTYDYGDLSYSIGALCLQRLSELVGVEAFDKATTEFLKKYKDTPVDFDLFCSEYIEQCNNPEVADFFQRWIYSDAYKDDIK